MVPQKEEVNKERVIKALFSREIVRELVMCLEMPSHRSDLLEVVHRCAMGEPGEFIELYIKEEMGFNERLLGCLEGEDRGVSSLVSEMLSRLTEP